MRVAVTASTGLIGRALAQSLTAGGIEVVRLVRRPPHGPAEVQWNPAAADGGLSAAVLSGVDAVVHLSGAPIAGGRWTDARKRELRSSRIASTAAITTAILSAPQPPRALLVASAIGWYGDTGDREVDESAPAGQGFLATLVADWEEAARPAAESGVRVVHLRSGIVLSARGGMLKPLLLPFRLGLGATLGSGTQYLSWIAIADHVRACRYLLDADLSGPVNLTAPAPVTNREFTAALARQLHRPALLRLPAGLLRAALGELSGELLGSCRVRPGRLEQAGFTFRYPQVGQAIAAALAADPAT
jgi:uncharacterized protein (TIGR01777 family)